MQNWFVVVMGIVTVFAVLVLIIGLCYILGLICRSKKAEKEQEDVPAPATTIVNRGELAAAVSAAIAEYSGSDAPAFRIVSIKKI